MSYNEIVVASSSNHQQHRPIRRHSYGKLCENGYMYQFCKSANDSITRFWRCDKGNDGCRARVHTNANNEIIKRIGTHTHDANPIRIAAYEFKRSLKRRAVDTIQVPPSELINQESASAIVDGTQLVNKDAMRKIIQRARLSAARDPQLIFEQMPDEDYKIMQYDEPVRDDSSPPGQCFYDILKRENR